MSEDYYVNMLCYKEAIQNIASENHSATAKEYAKSILDVLGPIKIENENNPNNKKESKYVLFGEELGKLVEAKQRKYGNSFGRSEEVLKTLYPNGIRTEQYKNLLTIVRIIDKLFRLATNTDDDEETPGKDISGYGLLHWINFEERKNENKKDDNLSGNE